MAIVNGDNYTHVDIVNGGTTTRHILEDTQARTDASNLKSASVNNDIALLLSYTAGYVKTDGTIASSTAHYYSELIPVEAGERYLIHGYESSGVLWVAFYEADAENANASVSIPAPGAPAIDVDRYFTIPENITHMRLMYNKTYGKPTLYKRTTLSGIAQQADVSLNRDAFIKNNLLDILSYTKGYVNKNDGTITSSNTHFYSQLFPVEAGERYHLYGYESAGTILLAYYADDDPATAAMVEQSIIGETAVFDGDIMVPEGAKFARVCYNKNFVQTYKPSLYKRTNVDLENRLPTYWETYLNSKKQALMNADMAVGRRGIEFAFVTDQHLEYNAKKSPMVLKWLVENTGIRQAISGGDIITVSETKEEAVNYFNWCATNTKDIPCVNFHGNHDLNGFAQDDAAKLTRDDLYPLLYSHNEDIETFSFVGNGINAYQDFENQKIRFIYCDIGAHQAIETWFTELDSSWTIVVFAHIYWQSNDGGGISVATSGEELLNRIIALIPNMQATIAALITGHTHVDHSADSGHGFPIISTSCDAYDSRRALDNNPRTLGTTTEQCMDLFYINTKNKTISTIRIGAGDTTADRSFTYSATT